MRNLLLIVSLSCVLGSPACMVIEEVDNAAAKMPNARTRPSTESETSPEPGSSFAAKKDAVLERSQQWWDRATSLSSESVDSKIAQCTLGGRTQFMSRDDCLARGGQPRGV